MTLIAMCSRVLAEVGWPVPSAIVSDTDATSQQIFAIANTELRMLSQKYDWPHLETEYEINTVVDQEQYTWPADFRKVAFGSVFDTDEYYRIRGSMNIEQWNRLKYGLLGSVSHQRFRQGYDGGDPVIRLTPAPTEVRALVTTYYSKHYAQNGAGVSQELYVLDTDISRIPEELVELGVKWRFRRAKGLDFSAELAEYNGQVAQQFSAYVAPADIPVGGIRLADPDGLTSGYVPDNGFGV